MTLKVTLSVMCDISLFLGIFLTTNRDLACQEVQRGCSIAITSVWLTLYLLTQRHTITLSMDLTRYWLSITGSTRTYRFVTDTLWWSSVSRYHQLPVHDPQYLVSHPACFTCSSMLVGVHKYPYSSQHFFTSPSIPFSSHNIISISLIMETHKVIKFPIQLLCWIHSMHIVLKNISTDVFRIGSWMRSNLLMRWVGWRWLMIRQPGIT